MSRYIRPRRHGATVFFTVALAHRGSDLLVREVGRLREAVAATRRERPVAIDAWGERRKRNRPVDGFSRERAGPGQDAGPSALRLDLAGGGRGLFGALGRDQGAVYAEFA